MDSLNKLQALVVDLESKKNEVLYFEQLQLTACAVDLASKQLQEAKQRVHEERDMLFKLVEEADKDRVALASHVRKLAQLRANLSPEEQAESESLAVAAEKEIAENKRKNEERLTFILREHDQAREEYDRQIAAYESIRQKLGNVNSEKIAALDAIFDRNYSETVTGQISRLEKEMKDFAEYPRLKQNLLLNIWTGRFRRLQKRLAANPEESTPEIERKMHSVFTTCNSYSRVYQPGQVPALQRAFAANWDQYIRKYELQLEEYEANKRSTEGVEVEV